MKVLPKGMHPKALILAPTRGGNANEKVAVQLAGNTDLRIVCL
jgi:hypothetical protein